MYGAIDLLEFKKKETSIGPINLGTLLKAVFHQDINALMEHFLEVLC